MAFDFASFFLLLASCVLHHFCVHSDSSILFKKTGDEHSIKHSYRIHFVCLIFCAHYLMIVENHPE